ncbi:uncharacterized protein Z520_09696 [Fonsecaea multimorphosa CBS 102226]|uniref:Uncharacterized protein n=1 Tax=Fonsecaea multimorphosa CBS 102226 TaxID=1442371 RepID=A0A0D2GYM5_9EURO|nr:uncharacterized protein Z520_09696 [Fonsecaea multimorphosa CBS 102226]KIX94650.1 hypothetical protein Z520_09696 [Fonsecaea multimorphosa CBS 102226]OAL20222.1 hypothetical protein AYO22_09069 [Fonsecaea multimorphosa]
MASASPKRKRGCPYPLDTDQPGFWLLSESDLEEYDEGSPRSKVARKFDDLEIHGLQDQGDHDASRKDTEQLIAPGMTSAGAPEGDKDFLTPKSKHMSEGEASVDSRTGTTLAKNLGKSSRSGSPPLAHEISSEFWQDSEITGHDPSDPDDDGYGINGLGFRPTAAIAWSRSQRRKQQLSDYKNREAREARQQRSERRKRGFDEGEDALSVKSSPRKTARVHFEDG